MGAEIRMFGESAFSKLIKSQFGSRRGARTTFEVGFRTRMGALTLCRRPSLSEYQRLVARDLTLWRSEQGRELSYVLVRSTVVNLGIADLPMVQLYGHLILHLRAIKCHCGSGLRFSMVGNLRLPKSTISMAL